MVDARLAVYLFSVIVGLALGEEPPKGYLVYNSSTECQTACVGDHDLNCVLAAKLATHEYYVCRCAGTYYSRLDFCQAECEDKQYWSLFTYGSCYEYTSKVLPGACNKQCVFRVRIWATVFIIILFLAAVVVIVAALPNLIISCMSCLRSRRHQRRIEDMQIVSSENGMSSGKSGAPVNTHSGNYANYAGYAGYGQRA